MIKLPCTPLVHQNWSVFGRIFFSFHIFVHILLADDAVEAEQGGAVQKGSLPSARPCSEHEKTGSLLATGYMLIADADADAHCWTKCWTICWCWCWGWRNKLCWLLLLILMIDVAHHAFQGRLVNIQNYSLSTIASVIKKFLRKVTKLSIVFNLKQGKEYTKIYFWNKNLADSGRDLWSGEWGNPLWLHQHHWSCGEDEGGPKEWQKKQQQPNREHVIWNLIHFSNVF